MTDGTEYRRPPRHVEWVLQRMYPDRGACTPLGDFSEVYNHILLEEGPLRAHAWLLRQILRSIPPFLANVFYWKSVMFGNYLKVALRNVTRHGMYSFVNIAGFAVGIASCSLIMLWVDFQLSYDEFHEAGPRLHQILVQGTTRNNPSTPAPLADALKASFPEISEVTRYDALSGDLLSRGDRRFYEPGLRAVDGSFFRMFTFPFVQGDPATALDDLRSIVISVDIARKFFPGEDPMGKVMTLDNRLEFVVTGVFEKVPANSTLRFDAAVPFENRIILARERGMEMDWGSYVPNTFIELREDCTAAEVEPKIAGLIRENVEGEDAVISTLPFTQRFLFFTNSMSLIYSFSAIALFILVIASINFVNLSTARSAGRAKEIGLRKVTGANRGNLISQFLGESLILSCIALVVAVLLVALVLPLFNAITGTPLSPDISILPALTGLAIFAGLAAGVYPAIALSRFQPVHVLRGGSGPGPGGALSRRILVVFQFAVSILLMIGTGVVHRQLGFIKDADIGYDKENIVGISFRGEDRRLYPALKNELLRDERIVGVAGSAEKLPYFWLSSGTAGWEGKDPDKEILVSVNMVDFDFVKTLGIDIVEGRGFSREFPSDAGSAYLVNEAMADIMGDGPVAGRSLTFWDKPGTVIGVTENFNYKPLDTRIEPLVLICDPERVCFMLVRIRPVDVSSSISFIEETWSRILPSSPFEFRFLDDAFDRRYRFIERMAGLAGGFAAVAVLIACLGLYGLSSFAVERRVKEIGIRKVLGASVSGVVFMLTKEFARCVLLANLLAWPAAYILMNRWLEDFAYRTSIGIETFILSGAAALVFALLMVGVQTLRAATADPVDALRYE